MTSGSEAVRVGEPWRQRRYVLSPLRLREELHGKSSDQVLGEIRRVDGCGCFIPCTVQAAPYQAATEDGKWDFILPPLSTTI